MPHHKPMVPDDYLPPSKLLTDEFLLRPLLLTDAIADYRAWTASIDELRGIFGPDSHWPSRAMTLEENAIDLAWHQREHESAASFAFTVFNPENTQCLGCVYLSPARKVGYEVEVFYWIRTGEGTVELDQKLGETVRQWLENDWPFESIVFPGRDIDWDSYLALPDQAHW